MIWFDPIASQIVEAGTEGAVPLFVALDRGSVWAMLRAPARQTFVAQALAVGLLWQDEDGTIDTARGVTISEIGPLVLETDAEGLPVRTDGRFHVNFWLAPEIVARMEWTGWALAWTFYGDEIGQRNAAEDGAAYLGIELIDPATVGSASNMLL